MTFIPTFSNSFSKLGEAFYSRTQARGLLNPRLVIADNEWVGTLGLQALSEEQFVKIFGGHTHPDSCVPLSMVYSGHQFGSYNPQLGDGRGILLGELQSKNACYDVHLKGAGVTPWSRFGDGYAVLRSCIREYLASVALPALGIASTHALCIVRGDDGVQREDIEPAAILTRLARTHVRFGHFEFFHYQQHVERVKQLADYIIARHFPEHKNKQDCYSLFFDEVVTRTAEMIAGWQAVGFAHGVMNTDNMSILGETFDYGPYGFMEAYEPAFICNHSDTWGRYAFDQQPSIGLWNLNALAYALSSLLDPKETRESLEKYEATLVKHYNTRLYKKLGWRREREGDQKRIAELFLLMEEFKLDYSNFFRHLSFVCDPQRIHQYIQKHKDTGPLNDWLNRFTQRSLLDFADPKDQQELMLRNNPKYILRNYLAQQVIEEAYEEERYDKLRELVKLLRKPFDEHPGYDNYCEDAPAWAQQLEVSCSS